METGDVSEARTWHSAMYHVPIRRYLEGCGDGPKKAVTPGIANTLPHRTKVRASRDEIPSQSVGEGTGIKS